MGEFNTGVGFQATVKLQCMEGQEYMGAVTLDHRQAEKSAAQQCLLIQAAQLASLPESKLNKRKLDVIAAGLSEPEPKQPKSETDPCKSLLYNACFKIARRELENDRDIVYLTQELEGGRHF